MLTNLLKKSKRLYYEKEFCKARNNPKKQWQLFNEFLNTPQRSITIDKINYKNETCTESTCIANSFSNYFYEVYNNNPIASSYPLKRCNHTFFLFPVSADEVCSAILNLKKTSPGLDNVSAYHLKLVAPRIAETLSHIINLIFKCGIFPSSLKKAKLIPVYKKGDKSQVSNYRPISILSSISKLIEKLFLKRLNSYLTKFKLLNPCQFGFRPGSSTSLAFIALTDYIRCSIDRGEFVGSVFLDFTKAFDTVNHPILFNKLESLGITGPALTFLKNYLLDREQIVCVRGAYSESKVINQGVPQGSILGPLLFCIYINDLSDSLNISNTILYADDTTISLSDKSLPSLLLKLNNELAKVVEWCQLNHLILNPVKTQFMIFKTKQRMLPCIPQVTLDSHLIAAADCVSFLGIKLDPNLKFTNHIALVKQKTAYGIRALIKSRAFFSEHALLSLYFAFIHSHITYGIASWGNTYSCHLLSIQHIQNQAIRIITNSSFYSDALPLLKANSILPVSGLFKYHLSIIFFKLLNKQLAYEFVDLNLLTNTNSTRFAHNNNFLLPKCSTNYGKMTSSFSAIKIWNDLPHSLKQTSSLNTFKHELKCFFLCK